jgi:5-formyltetrahydrofolate cyclo-ligase
MEKQRLRLELQNYLLEITDEQRAEKSERASQNLVSTKEFQSSSMVVMFLSLPHEVDTSEVILNAWQLGKTVAIPKISWEQRHMIPVEINSLETEFTTDIAGLRNPVTGAPVPFEEIDLVVTPALGFDRKGNRLGRGCSYYDRFFANEQLKARKCGFSFAEQIIDSIPVTSTDVPMDVLVTDEGVIYLDNL